MRRFSLGFTRGRGVCRAIATLLNLTLKIQAEVARIKATSPVAQQAPVVEGFFKFQ